MNNFYAIEIHSNISITDTAYGCVGGIFRFITGRPNYNGAPTYPKNEDGTDNAYEWYEGWISNKGISTASRQVDISKTGDYGTFSGLNFKIRNNDKFWSFIRDNNIYLINKTVKLFAVIDNIFYQVWQGAISNNPYNETDYSFQCSDDFKKIHKWLPPKIITKTNFNDAGNETQGSAIPVCFGNIPYLQLSKIESNINREYVTLNNINGIKYDITAAKAANFVTGFGYPRTLDIWTRGVAIQESALAGMFLFDVEDPNNGVKIVGSFPYPGGFNRLTLTEPLDFGDDMVPAYPKVLPTLGDSTNEMTTSDTLFYRVAPASVRSIISSNDISKIVLDPLGKPVLYSYSEDLKTFTSISDLIEDFDLTSENDLEHPFIEFKANSSITEDGISYLQPMIPDLASITLDRTSVNQVIYTKNQYPDIGKCTDRDRATKFVVNVPATDSTHIISFDIDMKKYFSDSMENLYFGVDFDMVAPSDVGTHGLKYISMRMDVRVYDIFGRSLPSIYEDRYVKYPNGTKYNDFGKTSNTFLSLPQEYYAAGGNINGETQNFFSLAVASGFSNLDSGTIDWMKKGICNSNLHVDLFFTEENLKKWGGTISIKQVGMLTKKTLSVANKNLYTKVQGELTDGTQTNNIYTTFKHILEDYDGIDSSSIDYFNIPSTRGDWWVGRQVTERKSSFDYLKELCSHSFTCIFPSRVGKRKLVAWRENTENPTTHDDNSIVRDSIKKYEKTKVQDLFTEFYLKYSFNNATGNYERSFFITNTDSTSFPLSSEKWQDFVGGLENDMYMDSSSLWTPCHESYLRANMVSNQLPKSLSELPWYIDEKIFDTTATSIYTGINSSIYKYAVNLTEWVTRQKDYVEYSLPLDSTFVKQDLLDPIIFNDIIYTDGTNRTGWINKIEIDPEEDKINIGLTLEPYDIIEVNDGVIIESGTQPDTITESGSQSDTITEL